jgi:cell division protein FtsL
MMALAAVWVHQRAVSLGYQLARVERELRVLEEAEHKLELEFAALTTPSRLVEIARQLNLAPPSVENQYHIPTPVIQKFE